MQLIYDIKPHPKDIKPSLVIGPMKTGYSSVCKINGCNVEVNTDTSEQFNDKRIINLKQCQQNPKKE